MKLFSSKKFIFACSAIAMLAGGALTLTPQDAGAYYSNFYAYDADNDGYIEETEYINYSYNMIDYDQDGYIDENEWDYYTSVWYEPYDAISYDTSYDFDYYDTDSDGFLEVSEYDQAYDRNIYDAWDADNDGYLEVTEYDRLSNTYSTYDYDNSYIW